MAKDGKRALNAKTNYKLNVELEDLERYLDFGERVTFEFQEC